MSRSQRTPSRAASSASNRDMTNNNAALLGALMAFGGASKSNGDMVRSRGSSPRAQGSPSGLSPTPSYRQTATAPATARVSPAAARPTRPDATAFAARDDTNDHTRTKTSRPSPPPLKPKPRRLSEHHYKPHPISPTTSFVGILENTTLRLPALKQQPNARHHFSESMEVCDPAKDAQAQSGSPEAGQKDPANSQKNKVLSNSRGSPAGRPSADRKAQDRTRAQVEARLAEAQVRARSCEIDSENDSEEYVSASEDAVLDSASPRRHRTRETARKRAPTPPSRSQPPPIVRERVATPSQPIDIPTTSTAFNSVTRPTSAHSNPSLNAAYHQLYPRRTTPLTLGDDLANAIVASSLASSRASSPSKLALPLVAPRRHHHHHLYPLESRTPSPTKKTKGMRHTLRDPDTSSSESDTGQHPYGKHKKKRHLRPKHPNKHHEGDRKRWRDAVTERERKRYEALFASNRGLLLPPTIYNEVSNIVVRDLWSRSRLPLMELEAVWNLAIASGPEPPKLPKTSLSKEEFVVGLWLIDQRLKGRKLPVKVSDTVWASVRGLQGIKIKKFIG